MNPWQLTQNLVWWLSQPQFVWPGGGEPVLGRVGVTVDAPTFNVLDQVVPSVLIRPERTVAHPEHPADLEEEARWSLVLYAMNATDQAGGAAIVGGNRKSTTSSEGRGLLEVEPLVRAQIQQAFLAAGVRPRIVSAPATVPEALKGVLAARAYEVLATRFPVQPTYAGVTRLLATLVGGATLTWTPVPSRWDLVGYQVNRATGSTPPATPSDGTVLTATLPPNASGYVDSTGGAGKAYSVFGIYDGTVDPFTGGRNSTNPITGYSGFWLPGAAAITYRPTTVTT